MMEGISVGIKSQSELEDLLLLQIGLLLGNGCQFEEPFLQDDSGQSLAPDLLGQIVTSSVVIVAIVQGLGQ